MRRRSGSERPRVPLEVLRIRRLIDDMRVSTEHGIDRRHEIADEPSDRVLHLLATCEICREPWPLVYQCISCLMHTHDNCWRVMEQHWLEIWSQVEAPPYLASADAAIWGGQTDELLKHCCVLCRGFRTHVSQQPQQQVRQS